MKRLQVMLQNDTFERISEVIAKCNEDFEDGNVRTQDVVEWMLAHGNFDIQKIRAKCLLPSRVKNNARLEYKEDVDELIKKLTQIKPLMKSKEEK